MKEHFVRQNCRTPEVIQLAVARPVDLDEAALPVPPAAETKRLGRLVEGRDRLLAGRRAAQNRAAPFPYFFTNGASALVTPLAPQGEMPVQYQITRKSAALR